MEEKEILKVCSELVGEITEEQTMLEESFYVRGDQKNASEQFIGLSSLELVEFIIMLEEHYKIAVTNEEVMKFIQMRDIVEFIKKELMIKRERELEIEAASQRLFGE